MNDPNPPSPPAASSSESAELPAGLESLAAEARGVDAGRDPAAGAPAAAPGQEPPPKPEIPTADFLEGMLAPLAAVAPRFHHGFAAQPITPAEVKRLAWGWAQVLDHYFPGGVAQWGPWGAALGATASVVAPRLLIPAPAPADEPKP